jgi:hypothetical protein
VALRANLHRRKAQARGRRASGEPESGPSGDHESPAVSGKTER